jgi:hypothetical protein
MEPVGGRHNRIPVGPVVGGKRGGKRKPDQCADVVRVRDDAGGARAVPIGFVVGQRERFEFNERERCNIAVAPSQPHAGPAGRTERNPKRVVVEFCEQRLDIEICAESWEAGSGGPLRSSDPG